MLSEGKTLDDLRVYKDENQAREAEADQQQRHREERRRQRAAEMMSNLQASVEETTDSLLINHPLSTPSASEENPDLGAQLEELTPESNDEVGESTLESSVKSGLESPAESEQGVYPIDTSSSSESSADDSDDDLPPSLLGPRS